MKNKKVVLILESILLLVLLQALLIGVGQIIAALLPELSKKLVTMCSMLLLYCPILLYIRARKVVLPIFPKPFSKLYIIVTVITAVLLVSTPSNYIGGLLSVVELFYGCIVTPIFEETVFRGYLWERTSTVYKSEKAAYILTTGLFTVWHIGYMLTNLMSGDFFAVATKLAAALVYGVVVGFARYKCKNLYMSVIVHCVMNLFMV